MSDWIEWKGGIKPPVDGDVLVQARLFDLKEEHQCDEAYPAKEWSWKWFDTGPGIGDIVEYRVVEPKQEETKHSHYFKSCPYDKIDYYRIAELYNITDPCIGHCVKKLLCAGNRGHKDLHKDIQDCIDTLVRWQQMRSEDEECLNKP